MNQTMQNGVGNDLVTEYYDPVAILLSSVNYDTENLTDQLRICGVKYNQLSGLVEEDLQLMGMTNKKAIEEILCELSSLSNQKRLYDSVLRNEFKPTEYAETVFKNCSEHVEAIRCMMNLIQLKTQACFPQNVLLDERIYASEFSLQLCDKIEAKIEDIQSAQGAKVDAGSKVCYNYKSFFRKISLPTIFISGVILFAFVHKRSKCMF
uniref:SAM domain-containing protein n=1 Tax=Anopheles dirus TaxID=7168 RepID=A0A182N444_9DIPT